MRTRIEPLGGERTQSIPSEPTPKLRWQMARTCAGVGRPTGEVRRIHHDVVVAQAWYL